MQDAMWAFMYLAVFALCATVVLKNVSRLRQINKAKPWPSVEATIKSGNLEIVRHKRFHDIQLPVFAFSYVVNQNTYVDNFALSLSREPIDSLITKMIGRKIIVQYDPQNPATCFIPGETMEGCKIEQRIGSQIHFYPQTDYGD